MFSTQSQQYVLPWKRWKVYNHCCPTQQLSRIIMEMLGQRYVTVMNTKPHEHQSRVLNTQRFGCKTAKKAFESFVCSKWRTPLQVC
jgi:hypothetical protein